jgi:hypothetical protein
MPHFTANNTFGYEPAGIKLLNKVFDKVAELDPGAKSREDKIAQAILDVVYDDSGNIDVADLARQVLAKLGAPG